MNNRAKLAISIGLLASAAAFGGQDGPPPPGPPPHMGGHGGGFGPGGMGMPGHNSKVVTGAPYSADVTSQSLETFADGNTISRTTAGHVARDSQGRTYSQETVTGGFMGNNGPVTLTFLNDPVAGYSYMLNATTKVATRMARRTPPASAGTNAAPPPREFGPGRDSANTVTADLGTQNINGVNAQGKTVTHTIPAGATGNSQPIVSTSSTWYSPDLQVIVSAKRTDPRSGTTNYNLSNIQRAEPLASLFQVPSDYTVQDGRGPGAFGRGPQHAQQ